MYNLVILHLKSYIIQPEIEIGMRLIETPPLSLLAIKI
jgi:hypothetical protein